MLVQVFASFVMRVVQCLAVSNSISYGAYWCANHDHASVGVAFFSLAFPSARFWWHICAQLLLSLSSIRHGIVWTRHSILRCTGIAVSQHWVQRWLHQSIKDAFAKWNTTHFSVCAILTPNCSWINYNVILFVAHINVLENEKDRIRALTCRTAIFIDSLLVHLLTAAGHRITCNLPNK